MNVGICAYPLSKGKETGRGLERVIDEFCTYLNDHHIPYDFYDSGIIRNELKAIVFSTKYFTRLKKTTNAIYFAIYPVAGIFPLLVKKKPVITAVHDLIPFLARGYDNALKYSIKRWCIRFSCNKSDALIVPFSSTKNKIVELFGVDKEKIFIIPYGVNHQTYYPDPSVKKNKNRIAFLGEAKRAKGMDALIHAFKIVVEKIPDATLHLASGGNELEEMKKLAQDMLPPATYQFVGFVPEHAMREFYNASDLLVFPSRYGFGLSSLEAMACGTPSIVGATLDALDFIQDPDLLADPDHVSDVAQKIINLLNDRNLHRQKSKEAIDIASGFSWQKMSENYYELCLKIGH